MQSVCLLVPFVFLIKLSSVDGMFSQATKKGYEPLSKQTLKEYEAFLPRFPAPYADEDMNFEKIVYQDNDYVLRIQHEKKKLASEQVKFQFRTLPTEGNMAPETICDITKLSRLLVTFSQGAEEKQKKLMEVLEQWKGEKVKDNDIQFHIPLKTELKRLELNKLSLDVDLYMLSTSSVQMKLNEILNVLFGSHGIPTYPFHVTNEDPYPTVFSKASGNHTPSNNAKYIFSLSPSSHHTDATKRTQRKKPTTAHDPVYSTLALRFRGLATRNMLESGTYLAFFDRYTKGANLKWARREKLEKKVFHMSPKMKILHLLEVLGRDRSGPFQRLEKDLKDMQRIFDYYVEYDQFQKASFFTIILQNMSKYCKNKLVSNNRRH